MAGAAARGCNFCIKCRNGLSANFKRMELSSSNKRIVQSRNASSSLNAIEEKNQKKRDKFTVLKALSSTVGEVPDRPDYRFFDDIILNARTSVKKRELTLAIESGTKAAEYVVKQYPDLVRLRQPEPAWPSSEIIPEDIEATTKNLKLLMKFKDNIPKIIEMYETLKTSGELTIEDHNEVLSYAAYYSIPSAGSVVMDGIEETSSSSSSSSSSSDSEGDIQNTHLTTWRNDGYAEQLFIELKDIANAQTYEAFLLGLLKHGEYVRAFHLFNEFKEKEMKGSLFVYNNLIDHIVDVRSGDQNRWDLAEEIVESMKGVHPSSVTFTNLMSVAAEQSNGAPVLCQRLYGEMKQLKIVPSLGSLYYLLAAERTAYENQKDYNQNIRILQFCVDEIEKNEVELDLIHPADVEFFHNAMHLARFKRIGGVAEKLFDVLMGNRLTHMLGIKGKTFFGNFLAAVSRSPKDMTSVIEQYDMVVPTFLVPHDWVYEQIFFAARKNSDTLHIPRLYSDMMKYNVYIMNKKLLPSLYLAMDCHIPQERAAEFLPIVEHSRHAVETVDVINEVRQNMLSTAINIYCMNGKTGDAIAMAKSFKSQGTNPTYKSLVKILEVNIEQKDKISALQTVKFIASMDFHSEDNLEEIISNSFLSSEIERIKSWFETS